MICSICGGTIKNGLTNLPIELETGILYIKQIPAEICNQCDEVFIPDEVAEQLEHLVAQARRQKVEIEVISYEGAA